MNNHKIILFPKPLCSAISMALGAGAPYFTSHLDGKIGLFRLRVIL